MVLKINTNAQYNWRFIDGIAQIEVRPTDEAQYAKEYGGQGRIYDNVFFCYHKIGDVLVSVDANPSTPVKEVTAWYEDEAKKPLSIILDVDAFLMSNEGKTIERIN